MIRIYVFIGFLYVMTFFHCLASGDSRFQTYLVSNGLSNSTVWCGMQDNWGFMWFGTGNGLNRFDGYEFRTFKDSLFCGQENMDIRTICQESPNIWWVGHEKGISLFDVQKECFTSILSSQIQIQVQRIVKDSIHQLIWIATRGKGIFRYDCNTKQLKRLSGNLTVVWDLALDEQGNLYAATHQNGLIGFRKTGIPFIHYSNKQTDKTYYIADNEVKSLLYQNGTIWVGTWQEGLYQIDLRKNKTTFFLSPKDSLYIPHLRTIVPRNEKELLLGTDEGVYVFNQENHKVYSLDNRKQPGLSDKAVHSITVDHAGGIWIGTVIGGINYLPFLRKKIETFNPFYNKIGFSGKIVTAFEEDPKGNLWIATEDGGLNYFDSQRKVTRTFLPRRGINSLTYHNLRSLLLDNDELWIGTFSKGVDRMNLKTGSFTNYQYKKSDTTSLSDNSIYALFKHSCGDIYIGTVWGLNKYNPHTNSFIRITEIDKATQVHSFAEDAKGNLWLATYNKGVYCYLFRQKRWVQYTVGKGKSGLSSHMTISLCIDHTQRLWVGTYGAGLCFFDSSRDTFQPYTSSKELSNTTIYSIEEDHSGNLWLGSDKGLFRLNPDVHGDVQRFTKEDGFQENQYYFNSALKTKDGKLYFGGINGFSSFYPDEITINPNKPEVRITSFSLYNTVLPVSEKGVLPRNITFMDTLELSYNQNMFGFFFSALNYENPEKNQYAYCLEGVDTEWIYTHHHFVTYANIQPGRYLFKVKAANNDGIWGVHEKKLRLIIHPPLWRSLPAYMLYGIFLCILAFVILRSAYNRVQRRSKLNMDRLQQVQERKMYQQKVDFFTQVAHDIRTPLSLIKGPLEEILETDHDKTFTAKMLKTMYRNVQYLIRLVDQLLLFRKIEGKGTELVLEECDVKELLSDIYKRFHIQAELKQLYLTLTLPDIPVCCMLDRFAFDKIVSNLLFNAFKFTRDTIHIELSAIDEQLTLTISDNGKGIPPSHYEQVFTPFYSSDQQQGTGLGLALTRQLTEAHHGTVQIEETQGGGASFIVQIPLCTVQKNETLPVWMQIQDIASPNLKGNNSGKYTILVAEDHAELRGFLLSILEDSYTVFLASDGEKAVAILKSEVIHLIISDVMMPHMNGLELCTYVKQDKALCYIPFVILTAKTSEEAHVQGLAQGADAYISKPFSGKVLLKQVESLLQNRQIWTQNYLSTPFHHIEQQGLNNQDKLFIEELNRTIDQKLQHEGRELSIDILASELGMSRSVLYRRIKGTFNLAPNDYLKSCKLKYAAYLLKEKGMRVNEVAECLGFSSSSYFARCFKEQFGMTPKEL